MNKSPINFLGGAIAGAIMGRRGKKKTARALGKIDKRLGSIEEKLTGMEANEMGTPPPEGLGGYEADSLSVEGDIPGASMDSGIEPVPGAVDVLEEDSFATAGDSGLNMMFKIARRKNK